MTFKEISPEGYVEDTFIFIRNENFYFMWSEVFSRVEDNNSFPFPINTL